MAAVLITASVFLPQQASAQAPNKMSYQAVVRDAKNKLLTNQSVGMQISILQGSPSGSTVYTETQIPTSNSNGLVSLEIGSGTVVSGTFNTIDWSSGPYFIKTETDPDGGTNYTITGTSQLLSVPYALHAKTAENVTGGISETDPVYSSWNKSDDISITNSQVTDFQTGVSSNTDVVANAAKATFPEAPNDGNEYVRKNEVWSVVTQSGVSDHTLLSNIGTNTHAEIDIHLADGTLHYSQAGISITESQISDLGNYESAFAKNTAFNKNFGNSAGTVTEGDDLRLSDARTPLFHAASHTDGTDDIQDASSSQKGLMTSTYASKLYGIEAAADVTDAINVDAAGAVMESDFDAGTILYATSDNTPEPKTVAETKAIFSLENVENTALSSWAGSGNITSLGTVTSGTLSTGAAVADVTMSLGADATGDIYFRSAGGKLKRLPVGTNKQVLTLENSVPVWKDIPTYAIGDFAQGGIVFWVDETGQHGLVCAKEDQSTIIRWYAGTFGNTRARGDGIYSGEMNTSIIIAAQVAFGDDGATYAAFECSTMQISEGGKTYGDWYLPSKRELNRMYINKATIDATAMANGGSVFDESWSWYWSSTEGTSVQAWAQNFPNGGSQQLNSKIGPGNVRAVRAF